MQFHDEGQSPYGYKFDDSQWVYFNSNEALKIGFGKQMSTIRLNKSNYTCIEDNSNRFMECLEQYYSKKLRCKPPWILKNNTGFQNLCSGVEKFQEYRNVSMSIFKPEIQQELMNENCLTQNCEQRLWEVQYRDTVFAEKIPKKYDMGVGFYFTLSSETKLLVREEVHLYTIVNVFADIGGYLGLLLGESLISYILMGSNWIQKFLHIFKAKFGKIKDKAEL